MEEHSIDAVDGLPVGGIVLTKVLAEDPRRHFAIQSQGSPQVRRQNVPENFHIFKRLFIVASILSENTGRLQFSLVFLIR